MLIGAVLVIGSPHPGTAEEGLPKSLSDSLSFAATFDRDFNADFSKGDGRLYSSKTIDRKQIDQSLTAPGVARVRLGARSGEALKFTKSDPRFLFFKAKKILIIKAIGPGRAAFRIL